MFDTHAHYDDDAFDEDRLELIDQLNMNGVSHIVNAGANIKSSQKSIELAEKYDFVYAAVGVHPDDAEKTKDDYIKVLYEMSKHPKCVAIGEIGLDYHYDFSPREMQKNFFKDQIELALKTDKPVIVHDREAHEDVMNILKSYKDKGVRGVMHCFSGSSEMAKELINMGFMLGIGGSLTFNNARKLVEIVEKVDIENIVSETDCPYLTPVPYRGKRNDSSYLKYIIQKIADIKKLSFEELDSILTENAKKLFKIK